MRRLKYYVASSLNGFIAREDGAVDYFVQHGEHIADFLDLLGDFDAALMGRKTYEVGLRVGVTDPYPVLRRYYVFTRSGMQSPHEKVEIVGHDAGAFVRRLKTEPGKDLWLCGGSELATSLAI